MSDVVNAEKLTETYLKIRDKRSKMSAEFKEKDKALTAQMDKVKRALLDYCAEHGLDSVKTPAGLEENPDLVPKGLNVDSEYAIAVRKK